MRLRTPLVLAATILTLPSLHAQSAAPQGWHAQSLTQAVVYTVLFSFLGIAIAVSGYYLFDKLTPGDLHGEIVRNKNIAAALVAAAMIIGTCIIVAAAMLG